MARRSSSFGERRGARQEGAKRGHPSDRAPGGRDWRPGDLITHLGDQHVEPMLVGRALGQGRAGAARNTTPREGDRGTGRCIGARERRRRRAPRRGSDRAATTAWRCGRARQPPHLGDLVVELGGGQHLRVRVVFRAEHRLVVLPPRALPSGRVRLAARERPSIDQSQVEEASSTAIGRDSEASKAKDLLVRRRWS